MEEELIRKGATAILIFGKKAGFNLIDPKTRDALIALYKQGAIDALDIVKRDNPQENIDDIPFKL